MRRSEHELKNTTPMNKAFTIHKGKKSQVEDVVTARQKMIEEIKFNHHRLEEVGEFGSVSYINDSSATSILATKDSLRCMNDPVIWVMCSTTYDRDFILLTKIVSFKVKAIVVCGQDAGDIRSELSALVKDFVVTDDLEDALVEAKGLAEVGDVVLFSPSTPASGQWANYVERGEDFKEKVFVVQGRL